MPPKGVPADSLLARTITPLRPRGIEVRFGRQVLVPLHGMQALEEPHPVRLDRARDREEELRSGTPSGTANFSIDATCIHHLIVKEQVDGRTVQTRPA
jgi:hypothetical protein